MEAIGAQHVTGDQAASARQTVRSRVEPVPVGGIARTVEPHRMVETGALEAIPIGDIVAEVGVRRPGGA